MGRIGAVQIIHHLLMIVDERKLVVSVMCHWNVDDHETEMDLTAKVCVKESQK
jgi:hypothetical protein